MILLDHLIRQFPTAKRQTLKRMVQDGRVWINGEAAMKLTQAVELTDTIEIDRPSPKPAPRSALQGRIIFEDEDVLVIDKPAGLLTSTVPREPRPTALAMVRDYLADREPKARVGLIHRLDRDASGLLVFSKNRSAHESLKRQFFHHTAGRIYAAIVSPPPRQPRGRIESSLIEYVDGSVHATRLAGRGRRAVTDYAVTKSNGDIAILRVTLQTGRKHQIRAHLAELGSPILGDTIYGGRECSAGLMLTAVELQLDHPRTGERKTFQIPLPKPMATVATWSVGAERKRV